MTHTLADMDIPDAVRDLIEPHLDPAPETLQQISVVLAQKRDEARTARVSSGIETIWREFEDAYIGIDDANRGEYGDNKMQKPMDPTGPLTTGKGMKGTEYRSTAFIRLTARYVDAGVAKLCEILLPPDDKAFSINEMPVPELLKAKDDTSQVVHDGLGGIPLTRAARPEEIPPPSSGVPGVPPLATGVAAASTPPGSAAAAAPATGSAGAVLPAGPVGGPAPAPRVPLLVKDLAEEHIQIARKKAKSAETRIYGWMVESNYTAEMRKVLFDSARLGTGCLKGPFPKASRGIVVNTGEDKSLNITIEDVIKPAVSWVDIWNIYPDPTCGEDIHNGDYVFEADYMSERQVRDLKKLPGYINTAIDAVLLEGPEKFTTTQDNPGRASTIVGSQQQLGRYGVWYFYGTLKREEVECIYSASNKTFADEKIPDTRREIYVIATMINKTVVRTVINPLDSGQFPYHLMPWQRRSGFWAGIGVGEQVRTPQRITNAAVRSMLNNAGKSAGSQIVIDQASIKPADGTHTIVPDKVWYKTADSPGTDVREAFMAIGIPNVTDAMMKIIDFGLKMAEEATSIPLVTQGQSGATTPDTFGATQLQDNNANQLLRGIGYTVDDNITEPVVRQCYEWLLLDPDVPDDEKGEFKINAHGSSALVERAIQDQTLAQLAAPSLNAAYGIDPKRWAKVYLKSKRLNPEDLQYTPEELQTMASTPPADPPIVAAAKVAAGVQMQKIVAGQSSDQQNMQHEAQLHADEQALEGKSVENDATRIEAERQRTQVEATVRLHELSMKRDTALMEYANRRGVSLDQAKTELAKTAMLVKAQRDLNAVDNAVDLHKHHNPPQPPGGGRKQPKHVLKPPVQTPGRAANGKAFEQAGQ